MSITISSLLPTATVAATNSSARLAAAQSTQQTQPQADTVRLSESQQVYELYNQGQRVSQIAANLSLTVSAVNSYLGISDTTS
jgi:DNA-binding NarL/FixJ family response regulator